ncbi:MAG: DUF481 domain-containing protein [Gammaproteobacteria bacterium]|nr:DUF481 domain-containing protein [Gammaproteobacteria bacterium]
MRKSLIVALLVVAAPLHAQESAGAAAAPEGPWSGKATLGYLATSGNTENSSLNAGFELAYTNDPWSHLLKAIAVNSSESNQTTAEAYELGWKTEYNFSEHNFMFGRVNWRKDRFSAYDTQVSETIGYGRRLLDTGAHMLNAEIGAGARQSERRDGVTENDVIFRAGLDYRWAFSETAEFRQDLVIEAGENNTYVESISAVKAQLIGALALVASYTIKNNSDVLPGIENTDTWTALSLEYNW